MNILKKVLLNKYFVVSAIIPLIIFYAFDHFNKTFTGIVVSAIWCIIVVIIEIIKNHKINFIAAISLILSIISLLSTVISNNPRYYLLSPIIGDVIFAVLFFGSLFTSKTIIEVIIEETMGTAYKRSNEKNYQSDKIHKNVYKIITFIWGCINIVEAGLSLILLNLLSVKSYYTFITIKSNTVSPLLIIFSIVLAKWYIETKTITKRSF
jgi:intracellular septation protein A